MIHPAALGVDWLTPHTPRFIANKQGFWVRINVSSFVCFYRPTGVQCAFSIACFSASGNGTCTFGKFGVLVIVAGRGWLAGGERNLPCMLFLSFSSASISVCPINQCIACWMLSHIPNRILGSLYRSFPHPLMHDVSDFGLFFDGCKPQPVLMETKRLQFHPLVPLRASMTQPKPHTARFILQKVSNYWVAGECKPPPSPTLWFGGVPNPPMVLHIRPLSCTLI